MSLRPNRLALASLALALALGLLSARTPAADKSPAGTISVATTTDDDAIKNRPIGTVMTYMTDLASGASDDRMRKIREQIPGALLGTAATVGRTFLICSIARSMLLSEPPKAWESSISAAAPNEVW